MDATDRFAALMIVWFSCFWVEPIVVLVVLVQLVELVVVVVLSGGRASVPIYKKRFGESTVSTILSAVASCRMYSWTLICGHFQSMSATAPVTYGHDADVLLITSESLSELLPSESTLCPGANISTQTP